MHKAGSRFGVPHSTLEYKVKEKQGGFQLPGGGGGGSDKYLKDFGLI